MTFDERVEGVRVIFLETAPVIYFVEDHPKYGALAARIFDRIDSGSLRAVTSPATLAECLVHPLKSGNREAIRLFTDLIVNGTNTAFTGIDQRISIRAAELRAGHNLTLADAFQAATALTAGCDSLLTNDPVLKRVSALDVIVLDEFAGT